MIKKIFDFLKGLVYLFCFLGQIILVYEIGLIVLKNQDLGMLILYFVACEFVLRMFKMPTITKIIISTCFKSEND